MKRSKIVVINADDFGLTRGVSLAIVELLAANRISSTTAMMCVPGSIELQSEFRAQVNSRKIGLHLQLTNGFSLTQNPKGLLTDPDTHRFGPKEQFADLDPRAVYDEWSAQVRLFASVYGHHPAHIDTHHGPHKVPALTEAYVQIARDTGAGARTGPAHVAKALTRAGIPHPDAIYDQWSLKRLPVNVLIDEIALRLAEPDIGCLEVETHPGYVDDDLMSSSSANVVRGVELEQLRLLTESHLNRLGAALGEYPSGRHE